MYLHYKQTGEEEEEEASASASVAELLCLTRLRRKILLFSPSSPSSRLNSFWTFEGEEALIDVTGHPSRKAKSSPPLPRPPPLFRWLQLLFIDEEAADTTF